jgi:hypothetical protein
MASKESSHKASPKPRSSPLARPEAAAIEQKSLPERLIQRARGAPDSLSPGELLQLQRALGNQAVGRLIGGARRRHPAVQAKLEVGSPEDEYEQEADEVADQVMRTPASSAPTVAPGTVQRKFRSGLAKKSLTKAFVNDAYAYWKDKANKDKPIRDLTDMLLLRVNDELNFPCLWAYKASGSRGSFSRTTWMITLNTSSFSKRAGVTKVGEHSKSEVARIVQTIYHEARHAQQYFRIARMKAGEGKNFLQIMTEMGIPPFVAAVAASKPLKPDSKANRKLLKEAKVWEQITVGKYGNYKGQINTVDDEVDEITAGFKAPSEAARITAIKPGIRKVGKRITDFFDKELVKVEKIAKLDKYDKKVRKTIKNMKKAFKKLKDAFKAQDGHPKKYNTASLKKLTRKLSAITYGAYRSHEHEVDAWAVGGAAGKRFKKKK